MTLEDVIASTERQASYNRPAYAETLNPTPTDVAVLDRERGERLLTHLAKVGAKCASCSSVEFTSDGKADFHDRALVVRARCKRCGLLQTYPEALVQAPPGPSLAELEAGRLQAAAEEQAKLQRPEAADKATAEQVRREAKAEPKLDPEEVRRRRELEKAREAAAGAVDAQERREDWARSMEISIEATRKSGPSQTQTEKAEAARQAELDREASVEADRIAAAQIGQRFGKYVDVIDKNRLDEAAKEADRRKRMGEDW